MNLRIRVFLFGIFASASLAAQPSGGAGQLPPNLRAQVFEGKITALRDLGSCIGRSGKPGEAAANLNDACFFFDPEWLNARRDRQVFFNYFYKNRGRFFYDDLLDAWLDAPIEEHVPPSKTEPLPAPEHPSFQLKKIGAELSAALERRDSAAISTAIEQLRWLENSGPLLFSTCKNLSPDQPRWLHTRLVRALADWPSDDRIGLILAWAKARRIDGDEAEYAIEAMINHYIGTDVPEIEAERVQFWRDSLGSLTAIRRHGFEAEIGARPIFFEDEVDYWGRVLASSGNLPWVRRNAVNALARSHHPRSLYYLATQVVKLRTGARFRSFPGTRGEIVKLVEKLSNQRTLVADSLGRLSATPPDRVWAFNYAAFWAKNWDHFDWDARREVFVDRLAAGSIEEETDRLFRRLGSAKDSAALDAYRRLTEADPATVLEKAEQYRQLVRSFNPLLPSFKYKFLEALVQLTDFCAEAGIDWRPSPRLDTLLKKLDDGPPPKLRYQIENQAVASLALADATALEYAACLRERDIDFNFSASRILDRLYTWRWAEVRDDPAQLRLFLKKAALFSQIGTVGACNSYLQKTGWRPPQPERKTIDGKSEAGTPARLDAAFSKALADLEKSEPDEDVLRTAALLLNAPGGREKTGPTSWEKFFEMPMSLKASELGQLPTLDKKGRRLFIKKFEAEKSTAAAARYLEYLAQQPDVVWTSDLIKMLDDPRRDTAVDVRGRSLAILEKLYQPGFGAMPDETRAARWKSVEKRWGSPESAAGGWRQLFFEEKLNRVETADSLSTADVNEVLRSPFFKPSLKTAVLWRLARVKPAASIKRLNPLTRFQVPDDLAFFENIPLGPRDLDDLSRLFQTDRPAELLDFFLRKSAGFGKAELGAFLNEIMRQDWLGSYLNTLDEPTDQTRQLQAALSAYLDSEDLSEFEEQATALHLLLLDKIGLSYREKLEATILLDLDARTKARLQQEILAAIPWSELADAAPLFNRLSEGDGGRPALQFLTTDFGLPPAEYAQNPENQAFTKLLKTKSQPEVIRFYLEQFGLAVPDLTNYDPAVFEKVADILAFDVTTPFVGGGGERRDWVVYGLIKLLEDRFATRLGFAEKLNENQTFYTFNPSKRAAAWLRFLEGKGLVAPKTNGGLPFVR